MKYINAEKLKRFVESIGLTPQKSADYNDGRNVVKMMVLDFIDSLQQEQPIQVNTLTWKDINDLERIINNVHYEFRNGIGEKSFGEEVLERFREGRDEQEQQENKPNLLKSLKEYFEKTPKEQLDADWEKLKVWNEIGPDVETYCKTQREQQEVDLEKCLPDARLPLSGRKAEEI